ncbi:MAG TPA: GGDEF domain-containing protein [Burkholderiaceae bacterium]|nr:GGDEF domain-containing protein [Burkholderiaceae bacterium]
MRRLIESVAEATRCRDRDDLDEAIARLVAEMVDPDRVTLYRVISDGEAQRVQRRISIERGGHVVGLDATEPRLLPSLREVTHWNECQMLADAVHWQSEDSTGRERLFSVFPLFGESELSRLVEIELDAERPALRTRDARLIGAVLRVVANHVSLLDYGEKDTLTGLMNRRTFEATFEKVRDRARHMARDGNSTLPSWLGVLDIDKFKTINDRFGHLFGDEVLLLVARLMRESFRGADQLFRFGGEEFSIILDRCAEPGAAAAFERLRAAIENHPFPQVGRVTVSLGYTQIRDVEASATAFERADAALYFAKNNGRNQIQGYERLLEAGLVQEIINTSDVEMF